ncbi:hypothetical protein ANCDUO_19817 [Ancylostoma duodenale]|uniref:Uncharacterized protein n=1 Tax=Ancylostoma duodenale TaxID=51022 RepID=A0A0C2CK00_9BILA|nr:hypothetical protein ANCDUO_19817 [Ancylostoma duodenale]
MGCGASISLAVLFPLSYVGLLHIADHDGTDRNDPRSIRKRFIAAAVNNVLSVAITYAVLSQRGDPFPLRSMGFRAEGTAAATILPAVLVTVLYTGQWMMMYLDGHLWSNFCELDRFHIRSSISGDTMMDKGFGFKIFKGVVIQASLVRSFVDAVRSMS